MKRNIEHKYDFGSVVYFVPATVRKKGIVTGVQFTPAWTVMYTVSWESGDTGNHWEYELVPKFVRDVEAELDLEEDES